MEDFRHGMFTVEDEVELAKSILESARVRKYFNRELEEIKENVPCLGEMDEDRLSTAELDDLSSIDFKKMISVAKRSELVFPLLDLLMVDRVKKAKRTNEKEDEEEDITSKEGENYPTKEEIRCATVLSAACYNRSSYCSGVQGLLGIFFRERGVKDTELRMLHNMGLSVALTSLDTLRNKLKDRGIKKPVQSGNPVVASGNLEQMEVQGTSQEVHSVTNAIDSEGINTPEKGLEALINAAEKVDTPPRDTIDPRTSKKVRISYK